MEHFVLNNYFTRMQPVLTKYHFSLVRCDIILSTYKIMYEKWRHNVLERIGTQWELVATQ